MSDFQQVMTNVQQINGVAGVAIVSAAGQLLESTLSNLTPEQANVASSIFGNINVQIKRMQRGTVQRLVLETEEGITLISGLARGELLVVFADVVDGFNLPQLLDVASRY